MSKIEKITNIDGLELEFISMEIKNNIGIVTINNPPLNILTEQVYTEIRKMFDHINIIDDVWVVILRAEGKSYPVGLDASAFKTNMVTGRQIESAQIFYRSTCSVYNCRVPVISAVHGFALGGGLCYAAGSDFVIAAEGAKFGFPEVNLGVVGGGAHLPRLVPPMIVRNMMFTGEFITAEELLKFGGITSIVPQEKLDETAWEKALELKSKGKLILRHLKAALNEQEDFQMEKKNQSDILHTAIMAKTDDLNEAVNAFLEKRPAVLTGK